MEREITASLRHNIAVNLLDGAFFGLALGFASFMTILPLFVSAMTASAVLIALVPAIHSVGWQLPQLFTARRVAQQRRYKPMVLGMSTLERLPFLGLTVAALISPALSNPSTLALTFSLLVFQGFGGGFTATAWQSMIAKIIPSTHRGAFFGMQAAVANLMASLSAILAGFILTNLSGPGDFVLCFLLAFLAMVISWGFLALTRESEGVPPDFAALPKGFRSRLGGILKNNGNFRWFLVARALSQLASIGAAFYAVFAVGQLGVSEVGIGWMTGLLLATKVLANPVMGWLGDRWSYKAVMELGLVAASASSLLAWWAPGAGWFYLVFILTGIADVAIWTIGLSMTLEFGEESERPAYIGLANTLIAPATLLAPFLGGWLANQSGYPAAFLASAIAGTTAVLVYQFLVQNRGKSAIYEPQQAINLPPVHPR